MKITSGDRFALCNSKVKQVELHGFCDSSIDAYCASVYVSVACHHGVKASLWGSKYRLGPCKSYAILRLELMSCLLLPKLSVTVKEVFECKFDLLGLFCWSASEVAL